MTATMTSKGQVTIPKEIREKMHLKPGDKIDFAEIEPGVMALRRVARTTLDDLAEIVKYDGPPLTCEEIDEAIGEAIAEDHDRILRESRA